MENYHTPVLLKVACDYLSIQPGGLYIDCTYGSGGHSREIISRGGEVIALDQDQDAISRATSQVGLTLKKGNFAYLKDHLNEVKVSKPVLGILVDLGISSHQINTPERGFSFQSSGPLDMRMDTSLQNSAATLINSLSEHDLSMLLEKYGELPNSKSIAKRIVSERPFASTTDLVRILPNPQTTRRVFQAFRIAVNDELGALDSLLDSVNEILAPQGRFAAISFHSLEDRAIKKSIQSWVDLGLGENLTPSPIVPNDEEIGLNPRSHSAKLRVYKKI